MRIAALDDDALQLDLFKQATEAMGHVCHTHLNGADFLREMRRETFDLLIVDWHLPDTTGPEVVRWVRKNVGTQLPILFVTHRQEERDIVEGLGSGADDFMVKPVRIGELKARVTALLRRAYGSVVVPPIFAKMSTDLKVSADVIEAAFVESNPGLARDQVTVTCTQGMIQEVRICLTPGLEPRRCGADVIRDCTMTDAALDAVR